MDLRMSRVLIIDDDLGTRALVEAVLQGKGIATQQAEQGEEGLEKARQNPPDLILCDLDMPVMDGIETLAEIRRDPLLKYIPFVLVTGMATAAQEQNMMRGGANGILRKPFSFAALLEIVRTHVDLPNGDPPRA
jgi:CheY-like chemotaxis protein